jgi:hypothetical protein
MRLVSQAVSGEPMHSVIAPKVIRSPAAWMLMSSPADNSGSMPAGASTEQPVTRLPNIRAVGVKRPATGGFSMQVHVEQACDQLKGAVRNSWSIAQAFARDFLGNAGLHRPNRLIYRSFPLTCARSQE